PYLRAARTSSKTSDGGRSPLKLIALLAIKWPSTSREAGRRGKPWGWELAMRRRFQSTFKNSDETKPPMSVTPSSASAITRVLTQVAGETWPLVTRKGRARVAANTCGSDRSAKRAGSSYNKDSENRRTWTCATKRKRLSAA